MQNLKRRWLVVSKLTWGIWRIWPEHLKVSKISTWMRSFWTKYILLELKKYIRVIFHDTEEKYEVWRGIKLSFRNWHKKIRQILTRTLESLKILCLDGLLVTKVYNVLAKKVQIEELSFMTLKSNTKFKEKPTCGLKNDMINFHQSTWKSQNRDFDGILFPKVENVLSSNLQRSYVSWQWRIMQNLKRNWLIISKLTWGIWQILTQALKNLKKLLFHWFLWPEYMFELKK